MNRITFIVLTSLFSCSLEAQCLDAFAKETGLSLADISTLEATLSASAKIGPLPKGNGSIFAFPSKVNFAGQASNLTLGYLTERKVSAITLGFESPIDPKVILAKYGLKVKLIDSEGVTFQCESDISFFVGKMGDTNAAMIKSVSEVDEILAPNL